MDGFERIFFMRRLVADWEPRVVPPIEAAEALFNVARDMSRRFPGIADLPLDRTLDDAADTAIEALAQEELMEVMDSLPDSLRRAVFARVTALTTMAMSYKRDGEEGFMVTPRGLAPEDLGVAMLLAMAREEGLRELLL